MRAVALAGAALGGSAALATEPGVGIVVAQLSGVPTSPSFKMGVNKSETGAPEATAIGARPIEKKASAPRGAEWRGKAAHPSSDQDEEDKKAADGKAGDKKAIDKKAVDAKSVDDARIAGAKPGAKAPSTDPMDVLREKLAAKLGARPAADGKFAMQVSNRGETGENVVTSVRPGAAALAGAHRAKRPAPMASSADGDANMDIAAHGGSALLPTHWDYAGAGGPESWGRMQPEFSKCSSGTRQSPIDIRGGIAVDLEPIRFDYRPSSFSVIDNGHTVQVNVEPGNSITITGRRYELVQFHFHRPSEERINGRQYDMVAHLVHKDPEGRLAVVAVLLDRGSAQAIVQAVWNNLPLEKGDEVHAGTRIDLAQLLPEDKRYYTYMGSLTTPPCSEGVLWMVMKEAVPVSAEQVAIFSRLYPMNARPIQQADGRLIKESN
jgi:carbonic anhydrase